MNIINYKQDEKEDEKIKKIFEENIEKKNEIINSFDSELKTLLHHAAEKGHVVLIQFLLSNGANPSFLDSHLRPAYFLCKTKEARNIFRRFMV